VRVSPAVAGEEGVTRENWGIISYPSGVRVDKHHGSTTWASFQSVRVCGKAANQTQEPIHTVALGLGLNQKDARNTYYAVVECRSANGKNRVLRRVPVTELAEKLAHISGDQRKHLVQLLTDPPALVNYQPKRSAAPAAENNDPPANSTRSAGTNRLVIPEPSVAKADRHKRRSPANKPTNEASNPIDEGKHNNEGMEVDADTADSLRMDDGSPDVSPAIHRLIPLRHSVSPMAGMAMPVLLYNSLPNPTNVLLM
jgi:hypothetical protein